MKKHEVYNYIADNLDWFRIGKEENLVFRTCHFIEWSINKHLAANKESTPHIKLSGATLTAMVYDGVLERKYNEQNRCFSYRPILPVNEKYKDN